MQNGLKIKWTDESTKNLESIVTYLESNWTQKELKRFFRKLEKQLYILSLFPEAYPISHKKKNVHRCVLLKNLTLYYSVADGSIIILSLFDTRQDLSKLKI